MGGSTYGNGEGPPTQVSLSRPELIAETDEQELRGRVLDEYLADYESRRGPISQQARQRARQAFDAAFAEEGERPSHLTGRAERRRLLREELDRYQAEFGLFTDEEMSQARELLPGTEAFRSPARPDPR